MSETIDMSIGDELLKHVEDSGGNTPLHQAVQKGDWVLLQLLLENDAPQAPNYNQETPLHWACRKGCPRMVEFLLESGADAHAIDQRGLTPLQWGVVHGNAEVVRVLKEQETVDSIALANALSLVESSEESNSELLEILTPPSAKKSSHFRTFIQFCKNPSS